MADKKGSVSRQSEPHSQREDNERISEQNTGNELQSRDTSDQTVESQDDNPSCRDTQLAAGSSLNVVDSKGPVHLGTGSSTVINNPTYNNYNNQHHHHHHHYHPPPHITNHEEYFRLVEQQAAALGASPTHPALPPCPVPQSLAGVQLQGHREEDITDISGQSQTHRKTALFSMHHDNSASHHMTCHCQDCLEYHQKDHPPLAELSSPESESRHSEPSRHPAPQQTKHRPCTKKSENFADSDTVTSATRTHNETKIAKSAAETPSQHTRQLPSEVRGLNPGQLETTSDVKSKGKRPHSARDNRHQLKRETVDQMSSLSPRPSPSDVTSNVTSADQAGKGVKSVKATHCENLSQVTPTVPRPDETSGMYREGIPDSVCIIDSKGRSLEPGDAVWFERGSDRKWPFNVFGGKSTSEWGIYVGHQQVVWSDWSRDRLVRKVELKLAQPFGKCRVDRGDVRPFPRGEVIRRAESRVGAEFTEGDWEWSDFPEWAMTGMGLLQAEWRGFGLCY